LSLSALGRRLLCRRRWTADRLVKDRLRTQVPAKYPKMMYEALDSIAGFEEDAAWNGTGSSA